MDIHGIWYNELGSQVDFIVNGNNLTGTYQTAVGDATGKYPLVGQLNTSTQTGQALAFVVVWQNPTKDSNSATAWSGQAQIIDGDDIIVTTWLLTGETETDEDWKSTLVGKDTFTRSPQLKKNIKKEARPFPIEV